MKKSPLTAKSTSFWVPKGPLGPITLKCFACHGLYHSKKDLISNIQCKNPRLCTKKTKKSLKNLHLRSLGAPGAHNTKYFAGQGLYHMYKVEISFIQPKIHMMVYKKPSCSQKKITFGVPRGPWGLWHWKFVSAGASFIPIRFKFLTK